MFSRGVKMLIIIGCGLLIIIVIALFVFSGEEKEPKEQQKGAEAPAAQGTPSLPKTVEPTPQEKAQMNVRKFAATFAERFGSFSTEGNFSNLDELQGMMTLEMQQWAKNFKAQQKKSATFVSIITKALNTEILFFDDWSNRASILVRTQRVETKADTASRTFYQDLTLSLARQGEVWLVDKAEWGEER